MGKWSTKPVSNDLQRMTLQGLAECTKRLQDVPVKIRKRILRKAMVAGGNPLVREARRAVLKDSGNLRKSLDKKIVSYDGGRVVVGIIGQQKRFRNAGVRRKGHGGISRTGAVVPIHLVENPTRPHRIPKEFRATRVKTTKEYRDAQRAAGTWTGGVWKRERRAPLVIQLPSGGQVIVTNINHPGTRGKPFMEMAASQSSVAADWFAAKMAIELDTEILALKALGWEGSG